jgi:Uncharacterised protein family UPF0547
MDDAPLEAEGTDSTVSLVGDKVVVRRRGVKTLLQRGLALYRDPRSLTRAFEGPSKKVVTAALLENKELAKVIAGAIKKPGSAEDAGGLGRALAEALRENRQAVVDAIKANDTLVKAWLRDHKDLAGIVLKGDVHVFVADVTTVALTTAGDGRRIFVLTADGNQLHVPYDPSHEDQFRGLCQALAGQAGPTAPLPPAPTPEATASAETKTCPMCAEEVKAAAVMCRFCGHRFDQ